MIGKNRIVTLNGCPQNLVGNDLMVGQVAPDFHIVDLDFKPFKFSDFKDNYVLSPR